LAVLHILDLLAFAAVLVWAAIGDMRRLIIPNWISVSIAGLFALHVGMSPVPVGILAAVGVAMATLVFGIALFAFNLIGGGDVKLMAAIALWAGPSRMLEFLFVTAITGGLVAAAALLRRWHLAPVGGTPGSAAAIEIPYGVAIAVGGLFIAVAIYCGN
jgi:prepilin peptidase CpaA